MIPFLVSRTFEDRKLKFTVKAEVISHNITETVYIATIGLTRHLSITHRITV